MDTEQTQAVKVDQKGGENGSLDLNTEFQKQIDRYVELNFHKELGLTEEAYKASFSPFTPRPDIVRNEFDIPIVVETRIGPGRQAELADIFDGTKGYGVQDWQLDPKRFKTPETPYTVWMNDGSKNLGKSAADVRNSLPADERGATLQEVVALLIHKPVILEKHAVMSVGTDFGRVVGMTVPALYTEKDGRKTLWNALAPQKYNTFSYPTCSR